MRVFNDAFEFGHDRNFPMKSIFDPVRMGAVSLDLMPSGRASAELMALRQRTRLTQLLEAARRGSALYRERLQGLSLVTTELGDLPVVCKHELMARFDDWVTDPQLKLATLRDFTVNPTCIGEPYLGKYLVWESSGTCHEPGIYVQDAQALAVYDALESVRRCAPRPLLRLFDPFLLGERIAFVGATSGHFASMVTMQRLRQINPFMAQRLRCFAIEQSTRDLVAELNRYAPTVIATYPTVAGLLADEFSRGALRFRPQEIWTGGETLTPAERLRVEQTLGCAVRNSYGASEFMSIGWECSHQQMHLNSDWVLLEPVDELGQPVPAGEASYTTLLTNLANYVQPLIRYDMGDQITVSPNRCRCGCALPVIEVQGRRDDALQMQGRDGLLVTLLPLALTTALEDEAGVFDFQICQRDAHTLVLRLNMQADEGARAMQRCRAVLADFAALHDLAPLEVIEELGLAIPRGRSGKAQRVMAQPCAERRDAADGFQAAA